MYNVVYSNCLYYLSIFWLTYNKKNPLKNISSALSQLNSALKITTSLSLNYNHGFHLGG